MVSSDEDGAGEPVLTETAATRDVISETPAERVAAVVPPHREEANESNVPASASPKSTSPPMAVDEPNISSAA